MHDYKHSGVGIFLLVTGIAMVAFLIWTFMQQSKCTEPVQATVLSHHTVEESDGDGGYDRKYYAKLSYQYNGTQYPAKGLKLSRESTMKERYPLGAAVTLYINPEKPEKYVNSARSIVDGIALAMGCLLFLGWTSVGIRMLGSPKQQKR